MLSCYFFFFFSSRRRHTRSKRDWSSDVCSSDLPRAGGRLCGETGRQGVSAISRVLNAGLNMPHHSVPRSPLGGENLPFVRKMLRTVQSPEGPAIDTARPRTRELPHERPVSLSRPAKTRSAL